MSDPSLSTGGLLQYIQHFVVLMLENRSFDHLFGYLKAQDLRVDGVTGNESNPANPAIPGSPETMISPATAFSMPFDPGHEFADVRYQLYAPSGPAADPAAMRGFLANAQAAAQPFPGDAPMVLQCFEPDRLRVLTALAQQFSLFNYYYSSLPGPTWPNRFFIHAATSGGLINSPGTGQIVDGFTFKGGTIYDALAKAGKDWRIYHDGMPQAAGIASLRAAYVDPFTKHFRAMDFFEGDVAANNLPEYTFIEPNYDTGNKYRNGNSMHPLNDIREGEKLVKRVYENLRQSNFWVGTMLIITFDEHGGFYDHVSPPATVATGDDATYADGANAFPFTRLGVRVPCLVVSPFTRKGTVIGQAADDAQTAFDHSSVLATVEKRFQLAPLTQRDKVANTLDVALNVSKPRMSSDDAPWSLPDPAPDFTPSAAPAVAAASVLPQAATAAAPLSKNEKTLVDLALACDLDTSPRSQHDSIMMRRFQLHRQADADEYVREVQDKIHSRRHTPPAPDRNDMPPVPRSKSKAPPKRKQPGKPTSRSPQRGKTRRSPR